MPAKSKLAANLSLREYHALSYAALASVFGISVQRLDVFKLASSKTLQAIDNAPTLNVQASAWFKLAKVQDFYKVERARFAASLELVKAKAVRDFARAHGIPTENDKTAPPTLTEQAATFVAKQLIGKRGRVSIGSTLNPKEYHGNNGTNADEESVANVGAQVLLQPAGDWQRDYTDREQMLQALNEQANAATDDKTRLDILKLISSIQQYSQAPGREEEDIKRFYMPLKCLECSIYKAAKEMMKDESKSE